MPLPTAMLWRCRLPMTMMSCWTIEMYQAPGGCCASVVPRNSSNNSNHRTSHRTLRLVTMLWFHCPVGGFSKDFFPLTLQRPSKTKASRNRNQHHHRQHHSNNHHRLHLSIPPQYPSVRGTTSSTRSCPVRSTVRRIRLTTSCSMQCTVTGLGRHRSVPHRTCPQPAWERVLVWPHCQTSILIRPAE